MDLWAGAPNLDGMEERTWLMDGMKKGHARLLIWLIGWLIKWDLTELSQRCMQDQRETRRNGPGRACMRASAHAWAPVRDQFRSLNYVAPLRFFLLKSRTDLWALFFNFQEASARGERACAGVVAASEFIHFFNTTNLFFQEKKQVC